MPNTGVRSVRSDAFGRFGRSVDQVSEVSGGSLDPGHSDATRTPHPAVLLSDFFGVDPRAGVWIERSGKTTRGARPHWLDWPSHTAAEMGPPPVAHADLAKQSKGVRR